MRVYENNDEYYIKNQLCKPINYELGIMLGFISFFPLLTPFGLIWLSINNKNFFIRFLIGIILTPLTFISGFTPIIIIYVAYIVFTYIENIIIFSRLLRSSGSPQKNFELEIKYRKNKENFCFIKVSDDDLIFD